MYLHYLLYRQADEICTNQETEIAFTVRMTEEITPQLDEYTDFYNFPWFEWASWHLVDENGVTIYDSLADHLPLFVSFEFQENILVDLCLPRELSYQFIFEDTYLSGAPSVSLIEVVKDGVVIERREGGDIGQSLVVDIPASSIPPPTPPPKSSKGK